MSLRLAAVLCTSILLGAACSDRSAAGSADAARDSTVVDAAPADEESSGDSGSVSDTDSHSQESGEDGSGSTDGASRSTDGGSGSTDSESGEDGSESTAGGAEDEPGVGQAGHAVDLDTAIAAYPFTLWPSARGDSGEVVLALQDRLDEVGMGSGGSDGSYGRRTAAAVEAFQRLVDLEPTGDAGPETIAALADYRYDGLLLRKGDEGPAVEELQHRLGAGPFDPGPVDGSYGSATVQAVWALEKLAGMPTDGDWGPFDEKAWQLLTAGEIGAPERSHETRWVEVDLSRQLVKVYDPDSPTPTLISHASSGSGIPWENEDHSGSSITPTGDFHISRRISGWRESSLNIGRLYNPLYFNGGIAFHGATSVPLYPASHGCVRLPMHIADYLPDELPNGTAVHVVS